MRGPKEVLVEHLSSVGKGASAVDSKETTKPLLSSAMHLLVHTFWSHPPQYPHLLVPTSEALQVVRDLAHKCERSYIALDPNTAYICTVKQVLQVLL